MDAKKEQEEEDENVVWFVCERRFKVLAIPFRSCCGARLGCRTHDDDDDNEIALPPSLPPSLIPRIEQQRASERQENSPTARQRKTTGKEKKQFFRSVNEVDSRKVQNIP